MFPGIKVNLEKDSIYSAIYENIPREQVYSIDINHDEEIYIDVVILADESTGEIDFSEIESTIVELLTEDIKMNVFVINNFKNTQYQEPIEEPKEEPIGLELEMNITDTE